MSVCISYKRQFIPSQWVLKTCLKMCITLRSPLERVQGVHQESFFLFTLTTEKVLFLKLLVAVMTLRDSALRSNFFAFKFRSNILKPIRIDYNG